MFGSMGQTNVKNLGNGGTMDGDVTITGDLTVSGGIGLSLSEVIEGTSTIDVTNTEALLVRKNGDGGDVFKVDTQNTRVGIGSTFSPSYLLHLKSGDNVMASFESTDANASIYLVDSNTTADATFKRVTNDLILLESGGSVGIGMSPSASHALAVGGDVQLTDQHPAINFTDSDDNSDSRIYHSAGSLYIDADNNNEVGSSIIRFSVDDSEVMRMVGSSVGIGAGTDTAKPLHIKSSDNQPLRVESTDAYSGIEIKDSGSSTLPPLISALSDDFIFYGGHGSARPTILTLTSSSQSATFSGDVSLNSALTLGVSGSTNGKINTPESMYFNIDSDNSQTDTEFVFGKNRSSDSGGSELMRLTESGMLGINDNNPSHPLSVNGAVTVYGQNTVHDVSAMVLGQESSSKSQIRVYGGDGTTQGSLEIVTSASDGVPTTTVMLLDSNSRISLSNNDSGTSNTIFGKTAGDSDGAGDFNVFVGELSGGTGTQTDDADGNVGVGYRALTDVTSGNQNIAIGKDALTNLTSGDSNIAIGSDALGTPTTAEDIVAIGRGSAYAVSSDNADGTVAIGRLALQALTTGAGNTSVGYHSSQAVTIGRYNTAFGHQALYSEDVGDRSTAVGWGALYSQNSDTNNEVAGNTGIGMQSGYTNVTGTYNTYVGYNAGYGGGSSSQNVAVGANSLIAVNGGDNNVAMGYGSAIALTSGGSNVAIGHSSMATATTASENVAIGYEALGDIDTGSGANVAIGYYAMRNVDEGSGGGDADYNIAIGYDALKGGDFASNDRQLQGNIAIGMQAMNSTADNAQTGTIAVGHQSLKALTSGTSNVAIGYSSMTANTNSSNNTAIGYYTLGNMDGGNGANTAVGNLAMLANTTGATNTAVGDNASRLNQTGVDNVAVGRSALYSNTTDRNTAVGLEAGYTTTGADNTYVGYYAGKGASGAETSNVGVGKSALLAVTTGSENVVLGFEAGLDLTSGAESVLIGSRAGYNLTTTSGNVAIGRYTLYNSGDAVDCIAIGRQAMYSGSATQAGTVAIGKDALVNLSSGVGSIAIGYQAGDAITSGDYNTAIGYQALSTEDTGDRNTAVGYGSLLNVNGANDNANTALGYLSGTNITTGIKNVAIGADAGGDLSTGDYNTIIGHTAAPNGGGGGENQIVIGYHVTGKGDNTATIGNGDCTDVYMAEDVGATVHCAGINFSATQPAPNAGSSSSEVLDGYEEGSWTPVITDGSNNATMSGTYNAGLYTKVGRVVHLTGYVVSTSLGSVSGDIKISGLPFTVKNAFGAISGGAVSTGGGLAITAGHSVTVGVAINTTTLTLKVSDATTGTTNMQHSEWTDDGNIGFSITYFV